MAAYKGRKFVRDINSDSIPASIELYAMKVSAHIEIDPNLPEDEPGFSFNHNGEYYISLNGNNLPERQRFTACHEIGHIELDLSSIHEGPRWSYQKRHINEILCDVFASELLLPFNLFKPLVDKVEISFSEISNLASKFEASLIATGSRFATANDRLCAFVISENGIIRYASRSKALRDSGAWIQPGIPIPPSSLSWESRNDKAYQTTRRIDAEHWLTDWRGNQELFEQTRYLAQWDQTLTLLWFEEDEIPSKIYSDKGYIEDTGFKELDGVLPWPGKSRRRP